MWIKHNDALYNSDHIMEIWQDKTKIKALMSGITKEADAYVVVLGEFKSVKNCGEIFRNISSRLLFDKDDEAGIIIKDTKK